MKNLRKLLSLLLVMACLCGTGSTALAAQHHTNAVISSSMRIDNYAMKSKKSSKKSMKSKGDFTVYVAPDHGKKWHIDRNCWTLSNSDNVKKMKKSKAVKKGCTKPCGVCSKGYK